MEIILTPELQSLVGAIVAAGGRPLLVGGCVRDAFLGLTSKDVDIEVHGQVSIDVLATTLSTLFKVDAVGKAFGVLKVRAGKTDVDVSLPRRDSKAGTSHRDFTIEVDQTMDEKEAASRRDFTINSIMYNPITKAVIDPWKGVQDLQDRVLRHTSPAFAEDPLRVLRLVQFVARFGFNVTSETMEMCGSLVDEFDTISKERIWMEFEKIGSKGKFIQTAMKTLVRTGWGVHFPEMTTQTGGTAQRSLRHTLMDGRENRTELTIAAIAMDTSSPLTFLERIDAPNKIVKMVQRFMGVQEISNQTGWVSSVARHLTPYTWEEYVLVTDCWSGLDTARRFGVEKGPVPLFVTGQDLLDAGLEPGPEIGKLLKLGTELQDNHFRSREEILVQLLG